MKVKRGQIYWLQPIGGGEHSMRKRRPYVVVSNNMNNEHAPIVNVCVVSSKSMDKLPMHAYFKNSKGEDNIVELEHIYTYSAENFTEKNYIETLPDKVMDLVSFKLGNQLGCYPVWIKSLKMWNIIFKYGYKAWKEVGFNYGEREGVI